MNITYDPYADVSYMRVSLKKANCVARTEEVRLDLLIDPGKNGAFLGLELLDVYSKMPKSSLRSVQFEFTTQEPTALLPASSSSFWASK